MITIYHNPRCGTSRTVLQKLRDSGADPVVVEYLKTPLDRNAIQVLIRDAGLTAREAIRAKEPIFTELGLDAPGLPDERLIAAMVEHPILLNRPFVVTPKGTRLCRPADLVDDIL
jgi:arsenate reductase